MKLLDESDWTAEPCGADHVVISVTENGGYRHFVRLPLHAPIDPIPADFPHD